MFLQKEHNKRTLLNAKLYPWLDPLSEIRNNDILSQLQLSFFTVGAFQLNTWRRCLRFSLEELISHADLDSLFKIRSEILSKISSKIFVDYVCKKKHMNFIGSIRYHISDGSVEQLLSRLDEGIRFLWKYFHKNSKLLFLFKLHWKTNLIYVFYLV